MTQELPTRWLSTPLGRRCLATEQRLVRRTLERMFGEQCLQIGIWGSTDSFLPYARTQRATSLEWRDGLTANVRSHTDRLAVASDSVDVVLLPHTLELIASPHALLREVDRVLRADGYLVVLSFQPRRYCHALPLEQIKRFGTLPKERWASRWLPGLGGGYLLSAQKRVHPLTPIRRPWARRHLKVVGGLVEPTARAPQRRQPQ